MVEAIDVVGSTADVSGISSTLESLVEPESKWRILRPTDSIGPKSNEESSTPAHEVREVNRRMGDVG